jgi:hypothetical protein
MSITAAKSHDHRVYERFNILDLPELKAKILGLSGTWQLVSMGEGGCGFYGSIKTPVKYLPKRARIKFEWETAFGRAFEVQAKLVYKVEKRLERHNVRYLGFAFDLKSMDEIFPLVNFLRELAEEGEIPSFLR